MIAAGGLGQAFATTSNPAGATGDGIAIAARAGAALRDLEFVQFHPTVLWLPGASGQCPLITEALRGAGAVLRDLDGTPLMAGHDPRGDLAPRDVVAARMAEVIAAGTAGHVWLDATGLDPDVLEKGFPTVTAACRKHSIDPVTEYIPVAPGAHYSCGGILADLDGRTEHPRALRGRRGRVDRGAGRQPARLQLGHRGGHRRPAGAAGLAARSASATPATPNRIRSATPATPIGAVDGVGDRTDVGGGGGSAAGGERRTVAWRPMPQAQDDVGGDGGRGAGAGGGGRLRWPCRGGRGFRGIGTGLASWSGWSAAGWETGAGGESPGTVRDEDWGVDLDLEAVEAANLRVVSGLIAAGALRRAESRGCHRRRDASGTAERPWHTVLRWDGQELVVNEEEL